LAEFRLLIGMLRQNKTPGQAARFGPALWEPPGVHHHHDIALHGLLTHELIEGHQLHLQAGPLEPGALCSGRETAVLDC
jgi:hypothetical protein